MFIKETIIGYRLTQKSGYIWVLLRGTVCPISINFCLVFPAMLRDADRKRVGGILLVY